MLGGDASSCLEEQTHQTPNQFTAVLSWLNHNLYLRYGNTVLLRVIVVDLFENSC